ncbi:MAG: HAMP domain-containing histidine kinase [Ardenticatenaceae bacterium]|nr:HAMP domain-containing histidine kinase [Anaerolineales bacterium]MCB8940978.1 HAMP domain-containing histidine kinase [Ardenticatenaceae bacterium]MCB8972317.1 HAMP domain-containing histidine kinase [Ardenticatenaceae bacterium]
MTENLKLWLRQQSAMLCAVTLNRAPNLLVDEDDLIEFLSVLVSSVGSLPELQLASVQSWALIAIGHDAPAAYDWMVLLRVLKEQIGRSLVEQLPAEDALTAWRLIDDVLIYAIIEATQLASDMQRSELLNHMSQLRSQQEKFKESKTKFIAVAAHELKTPLTILEGYTNILKAETQNEPQLNIYLEGLGNGFRRMHEIIGDMLDVSLLDLRTVELKYQEINLEKTVLLVADSVDRYYMTRRVDLKIVPFEFDSSTFGDPEKLKKALTKILMNGLKYTPDGGEVVVTGSLVRQDEVTDELAGFVDIQIMDTGIGIDTENLESIFEKFGSIADASLHSSSKTKFKGGGPGLGLPIARGIVEAHGGRVWAESPGCDEENCPGSTFHIELPIWLEPPDFQA